MPTYVVTGKLGGGKTLAMVGRIREYIERGRPVATNINLNLRKLVKSPPRAMVLRLPDRPTADDLAEIGAVHNTGREELNGALVLDECGTWLNSRQWNDKGRQALMDWFLHARKLGWDVYLIVQNITLLDKQLREALAEYHVICRRLDRMKIPGVGRVIKGLSLGMLSGNMPRVHIASVRYGLGPSSIHADTWTYRGTDLYAAYETVQVVSEQRVPTHALVWDEPVKVRAVKPKLPALVLAGQLERDEAWAWARRYVAALPDPSRASLVPAP